MNNQTTNAANINPVIIAFISVHIYAWTNFCNYHCQKQKDIHPARVYFENLQIEILSLSIGRMLQLKEKTVLNLLSKNTGSKGYSEMDIWMLRKIKISVFSTYSARSKWRIL